MATSKAAATPENTGRRSGTFTGNFLAIAPRAKPNGGVGWKNRNQVPCLLRSVLFYRLALCADYHFSGVGVYGTVGCFQKLRLEMFLFMAGVLVVITAALVFWCGARRAESH